MMRICIAGTVAKPNAPMNTSAMIVAIWLPATWENTARMMTSPMSRVISVAPRLLSAARPPRKLPMNSPTPKRTRSQGTDELANPETPVNVNAI